MEKPKMLWQDGSRTAQIPIEKLSLGKLIGIKHFIKARPNVVEFYNFTRQAWNDALFTEIGKRHSKCIGFILAQNSRKLEEIIIKMGIFDKQHLDKGRRIIQAHKAALRQENSTKIQNYQGTSRRQRTIGELIKTT